MIVACGSASVPIAGQSVSGDRIVVAELAGGALVAVIDGLGHGREADDAARAAANAIQEDPAALVEQLVERCHARLRGTRGCVMTLARFAANDDALTWVGVGNVEAVLVRAPGAPGCDEALVTRGGIVGYRLPRLVSRTLAVARGDTLALASDGIRHGFRIAITATGEPQELADRILAGWSTGHDDACVLVARYLGAAA